MPVCCGEEIHPPVNVQELQYCSQFIRLWASVLSAIQRGCNLKLSYSKILAFAEKLCYGYGAGILQHTQSNGWLVGVHLQMRFGLHYTTLIGANFYACVPTPYVQSLLILYITTHMHNVQLHVPYFLEISLL